MADQSEIDRILAQYGDDPRAAYRDPLERYRREDFTANPWAVGAAAPQPPEARSYNPNANRPHDQFATRVAEGIDPLSPGAALWDSGKAAVQAGARGNYWDAVKEMAPLALGMAVPIPGIKGKAMPRELDSHGFYSQALESAKALPQAKGTGDQVLAMLRKGGKGYGPVKEAELQATGLDKFLEGRESVNIDEVLSHLRDNRVQLQEGRYGQPTPTSEDFAAYRKANDLAPNAKVSFDDLAAWQGVKGAPKWAEHSLDPSNTTYRESVLHLAPPTFEQWYPKQAKIVEGFGPLEGLSKTQLAAARQAYNAQRNTSFPSDFRGGHWDEPNVIAHMRTSMQKDAQGKPIYLVDELQSDWGQKLRDGGVRDEAKIAELAQRKEDLYGTINRLKPEGVEWSDLNHAMTAADFYGGVDGLRAHVAAHPDAVSAASALPIAEKFPPEFWDAVKGIKLTEAELKTATAATPGHPLVNTTDQWTTTAMRRLMQQAAESGAEGIALTPGQMQNERFGLEKHVRELAYDPQARILTARLHNGRRGETFNDVGPEKLPEIIGKEVAASLLARPLSPDTLGPNMQVLGGQDLKMGGAGMRYAYDQMYPKQLEKQLRKLDPEYPGRSETHIVADEFPNSFSGEPKSVQTPQGHRLAYPDPFHYFPLTPKVKEEIAKGLPLFGGAGVAALLNELYGDGKKGE